MRILRMSTTRFQRVPTARSRRNSFARGECHFDQARGRGPRSPAFSRRRRRDKLARGVSPGLRYANKRAAGGGGIRPRLFQVDRYAARSRGLNNNSLAGSRGLRPGLTHAASFGRCKASGKPPASRPLEAASMLGANFVTALPRRIGLAARNLVATG
jgi:hypothetical protein